VSKNSCVILFCFRAFSFCKTVQQNYRRVIYFYKKFHEITENHKKKKKIRLKTIKKDDFLEYQETKTPKKGVKFRQFFFTHPEFWQDFTPYIGKHRTL